MPWNHRQPRPSVGYLNAAPGRPPADNAPGPTLVAHTGPTSEMNSGSVPNSSARRSASRFASSCAYVCWTNHRSAPTARRCRISSTNRSTARLRVRTRSTTLNPNSPIKIGLRSSADPSHAAAPPIRPPRLRYSSVSTTTHCLTSWRARRVAAITPEPSSPAAAARAAAALGFQPCGCLPSHRAGLGHA
jgi:hypothetical protein